MKMNLLTFLAIFLVPLIQCAPQAHEMTASYRRLGPRYQILKEYVLSGQKNVRYETKPIQYQDAQGKWKCTAQAFGHLP